ncbi:hypothetical protein IGI04_031082 [Brassica rapa subsp. trilocularis]|uniref:Response regulatory domain-containing protein n=1 Tax=Brassica rapa subsp. trilocularis TaxID=1813537 RepID=A0ABQ7LWJ9_BRACM|nr:hypothetical protein IGI04_031082 [Brassica rapa subsp. trilocularis]
MTDSLALYKDRLLGNICAVTTANKAQTALELLRDNRNKFDLVISDLEMDLTDRIDLKYVMEGVKYGACDYLLEPWKKTKEEMKTMTRRLTKTSCNLDARAAQQVPSSSSNNTRREHNEHQLVSECLVNEKCDVYGFGVLILELLTGRRLVEYGEDSFVILSDHVRVLLEQGNVLECIDPTMEEEYSEDEVLPFLKLSIVCTSQIPSNLPTMAEIVQILQAITSPVPHRHRMLDSFSKSSVLI